VSPEILNWSQIEQRLAALDLVGVMQLAFAAYSRNEAEIPPVGEMLFSDPPGEVHIKYGYLRGGSHYVVKIASGFYGNPARDLASSQGLMLLFDQRTGVPSTILLDEGRLTDARTGAAGALAAAKLAPPRLEKIAVVGSGTQARVQLEYLRQVTDCRDVGVWGRDPGRARDCAADLEELGYRAQAVTKLQAVVRDSDLVITTTPSREALIRSEWVSPGTHITAMGSDTPDKQELDTALIARAQLLVVDSRSQSNSRGEMYRARRAGVELDGRLVELGELCQPDSQFRREPDAISVADLTGVAVQDLAAALAVAKV
jgi:ornithine cyclodeaminase